MVRGIYLITYKDIYVNKKLLNSGYTVLNEGEEWAMGKYSIGNILLLNYKVGVCIITELFVHLGMV